MNTQPIDWELVGIKQDTLAGAMGFAFAGFGESAAPFFEKFRRSGWMARFERSEGRATAGCSGSELALMIYTSQAGLINARILRASATLTRSLRPLNTGSVMRSDIYRADRILPSIRYSGVFRSRAGTICIRCTK